VNLIRDTDSVLRSIGSSSLDGPGDCVVYSAAHVRAAGRVTDMWHTPPPATSAGLADGNTDSNDNNADGNDNNDNNDNDVEDDDNDEDDDEDEDGEDCEGEERRLLAAGLQLVDRLQRASLEDLALLDGVLASAVQSCS
jgi:hypothetical protein